eukprot:10292738-Prorocentrum_lima.AAC.1
MTSSLVGSEMCIRDRWQGCGCDKALGWPRLLGGWEKALEWQGFLGSQRDVGMLRWMAMLLVPQMGAFACGLQVLPLTSWSSPVD